MTCGRARSGKGPRQGTVLVFMSQKLRGESCKKEEVVNSIDCSSAEFIDWRKPGHRLRAMGRSEAKVQGGLALGKFQQKGPLSSDGKKRGRPEGVFEVVLIRREWERGEEETGMW